MSGERLGFEKNPKGTGNAGGSFYLGVPPIIGPDDWNFGDNAAADTNTRWGISTHVTVDPTQLERGDIWQATNTIRYRVLNGRLLIQTSGDDVEYEIMSYALTGGSRIDDAIALTFTADDSTYVADSESMTVFFSQTLSGDIDFNNGLLVTIGRSYGGYWVVVAALIEAGVGGSLYSTSIYDFNCPISALAIGMNGGVLSVWVGPLLTKMTRIAGQISTGITPNRVTVTMKTLGYPNRTWGLESFRRKTHVTF